MPNCIQCNNCIVICPEQAIIQDNSVYLVDHWKCSLCAICIEACPDKAIKLVTNEND